MLRHGLALVSPARRLRALLLAGLVGLTSLATGAPASAGPGVFDPAFAGGGRVALGNEFRVVALDQLADDRFVTVSLRPTNTDGIDVRRFSPTGIPDLTFAGTGVVQVGGPAEWGAAEVAVDSATGTTYVSAYSQTGGFSRVWRFTGAGALDPAWGGTGRVDFNASRFLDIALQPDGRLVVANGAAVYRLGPTGVVDPTFGSAGGVSLATGQVDNLVVRSDGTILAGGRSAASIDVFRLGRNGALDGDFGTNGRASHRPTPPLGWNVVGIEPVSIGVQNDGGVVVSSGAIEQNATNNNQRSPLVVTRFHEGGGADGSFASIKSYDLTVSGKLSIQANDKIIVPIVAADRATLMRLQGDGRPDLAFGLAGGWTDTATGTRPTATLVQRPGRIVVSGVATGQTGLLWGIEGDATPGCNGRLATAYGGDGSDVLLGTDGDDVIVGGKGKDTIKSGDGHDLVCGEKGKDLIIAGPGKDRLEGGADADLLKGYGGKDLLQGGGGDDRLEGGKGPDKLHGGPGDDRLFGGPGRDKLSGGPGRDVERQ